MKVTFEPIGSEIVGLELSELELAWDGASTGSMIEQLGFKPDESKAYMQFSIQHAMPSVAGPTMKGNYLAYHPAVIDRSHRGLLHQQLNLEHRIKRYNPEQVSRDRIVGAIVAVKFPPQPPMGWKIGDDAQHAPAIRAVATIFKKAEGVPRVIGEHQGSKEKWNNSIEVLYKTDDLGVYIPSRREVIAPLSNLDEAGMKDVVYRDKKTNQLMIGKHQGEQLALAPGGIDGAIGYDGVGMTKTPAEREAEIEQVLASRAEVQGELCSIPPEMHMAAMIRWVRFATAAGRRATARVREVQISGTVKLGSVRMEATPEDPVLVCVNDRAGTHGSAPYEFLRHLSSVEVC